MNNFVLMFLLSGIFCLIGGCGLDLTFSQPGAGSASDIDREIHSGYAPAKVKILPLTEVIKPQGGSSVKIIRVFVSVLDSFGCQVKVPGVFRFELYEKIERSARPKGKRMAIWPDFDMKMAEVNNSYWQDFLRAYRFELDLEISSASDYILQVTFLSSQDKRITADYFVKRPG